MIENPPTARILQISPKETITYDMPWATYELIRDVLDTWHLFHSRRDKGTVEKVLQMIEECAVPQIREYVTAKREPTNPEIKGLRADAVWYDEFKYSEDLT